MYACQECGRKFKTTKAAERASNNGCPKCGGVDIDLDTCDLPKEREITKDPSKVKTRFDNVKW